MNNWVDYNGEYEKKFYDLKLKVGVIISHCWPVQGSFNPVDSTGACFIDGWQIDQIRISETQWLFDRPSSQ